MSIFPDRIEFAESFGAPACDDARFLMALAPADGPLPEPPRRCNWLTHDGIAALSREGAPATEGVWTDALWRVPGVTRLEPQPAFAGPPELSRMLEGQALPLRRMLALREPCAEYRVSVSGATQPADTRIFARLAQDLADLSQAVRAAPAGLLPIAAGPLLIAVSLMVHVDRIGRLLSVLDEAEHAAGTRGLTLDVIGPDALRSFPVSLSVGGALALTQL